MIHLANERGGDDNSTVLIAEATGDDLSVYRDEETVTQTFEVVKAGPNTDIKSERPPPDPPSKATRCCSSGRWRPWFAIRSTR